MRRVATVNHVRIAARSKLLTSVLADDLEHPEARTSPNQQILRYQRLENLERGASDVPSRLDRCTASED